MAGRILAAEDAFNLAGTSKKVRVQVFAPIPFERTTWACQVRMGSPLNRDRPSYGEGPLQALVLALSKAAIDLYCSEAWREGRLGWKGKFGGYLGLPAPTMFLDFAPFPFDLGRDEDRSAVLMYPGDESESSAAMVEETLMVTEPRHPMAVRLFAPEPHHTGWRCRVQIDHPIGIDRYALGASGLEALWRALCLMAGELYGSPLWRAGKLGAFDDPGGFLGVPPPTSLAFLTKHAF